MNRRPLSACFALAALLICSCDGGGGGGPDAADNGTVPTASGEHSKAGAPPQAASPAKPAEASPPRQAGADSGLSRKRQRLQADSLRAAQAVAEIAETSVGTSLVASDAVAFGPEQGYSLGIDVSADALLELRLKASAAAAALTAAEQAKAKAAEADGDETSAQEIISQPQYSPENAPAHEELLRTLEQNRKAAPPGSAPDFDFLLPDSL